MHKKYQKSSVQRVDANFYLFCCFVFYFYSRARLRQKGGTSPVQYSNIKQSKELLKLFDLSWFIYI